MIPPEGYPDVQGEIEKVRSIVGKHFSVYETRAAPDLLSFHCRSLSPDISGAFDALRLDLKKAGYIPLLALESGEHIVHVQRMPRRRFWSSKVNLAFLIATIVTTSIAGMWNWSAYEDIPWSLESLGKGIVFFSIPLMLILGIHELGHYFMAKKHNVDASLPFFIPLPISSLGTLGAVISMREPIPNRKALIDIGAAGPIAGLVVAIPIAILGWYLTGAMARPLPANVGDEGSMVIYFPFMYEVITWLMPITQSVALHPMAFAGWVGIFVTALNLIPAGQLDGGHIARAALGDKAKYLSYGALGFLLLAGMIFYPGWIIIGLLVILLGARHPPPLNDVTRLDGKRKILGVCMALIMVVSFTPVPMAIVEPVHHFEFRDAVATNTTIHELNLTATADSTFNCTFVLNNTGNAKASINLSMNSQSLSTLRNYGWNFSFAAEGIEPANYTETHEVVLNSSESGNVTIMVTVPPSAEKDKTYSIDVEAVDSFAPSVVRKLTLNILIQ